MKKQKFFDFFSRGCAGNANNFKTKELCQKRCEPPPPSHIKPWLQ